MSNKDPFMYNGNNGWPRCGLELTVEQKIWQENNTTTMNVDAKPMIEPDQVEIKNKKVRNILLSNNTDNDKLSEISSLFLITRHEFSLRSRDEKVKLLCDGVFITE